jgi:sec-independent protein translocase protein TatB
LFNIGPMELLVLALVGIVVLGPDRLPGFARDAARLLRTLRDMATGARQQLKDELGPEFADVDLRNLNPRTAVQRAVFGDEMPDFRKFSPSAMVRDAIFVDDDEDAAAEAAATAGAEPETPISMTKPSASMAPSPANGARSANGARPRPRPRPSTHYDDDAT